MTASSAETLYFHCHACGIRLSVPATLAGVSGPCPNCAVNLVGPTYSERRRTVQIASPGQSEKQQSERPQWNELEKSTNPQTPAVGTQSPATGEVNLPSSDEQEAAPPESSHPTPLSSQDSNSISLPPRKSEAAQTSPSLSEPLAVDGRDESQQSQTWVGRSEKVQLPAKKTGGEALPSSQSSKTVLPERREQRPNIGFENDEHGRPIWRPPVEPVGQSAGFLQLPDSIERDAPKSRARAILMALILILSAAGGLAYVFQDQWMPLWATYQMRDQKVNKPAAQYTASGKRSLPTPEELSRDLKAAESALNKPSSTSLEPVAASSVSQTDTLPPEPPTPPPQPQVMESDLIALPSAVADAVVVQPKAEFIEPAAPPADAPASLPNESGVFVPRGTSSKRLIASGAPFAEADAWVMDAPEDRPPFTKPIVLPEFLNNPPAELEEPVNSLRRFLLAESWEERLKHVLWPDQIRPLMQIYYQKHDDGPIEVQHADVLPGEPGAGEASQQVFLLGGKDMPQPVPIMVEKTPKGWQVDWAIFVEGREKLLEKFFAAKGDISAPFRVFVRRKRYFGEDVPDLENKLCYEIQPPAQGFIGHAFADKNSPLAAVLDRYLGWDVLNAPVVMELRWKNDGEGGWMEIVGLAHENWRTPKMEPRLLK